MRASEEAGWASEAARKASEAAFVSHAHQFLGYQISELCSERWPPEGIMTATLAQISEGIGSLRNGWGAG